MYEWVRIALHVDDMKSIYMVIRCLCEICDPLVTRNTERLPKQLGLTVTDTIVMTWW